MPRCVIFGEKEVHFRHAAELASETDDILRLIGEEFEVACGRPQVSAAARGSGLDGLSRAFYISNEK